MPSWRPIQLQDCFISSLLFVICVFLTILGDSGACLNGPRPVLNLHESQAIHDLLCFEGELQVLLVGEHQQRHVLEVVLAQQALELLNALLQSHLVRGVHHVDETVRVLVVVLPVGADRLLTTDVPNIQLEAVLGLIKQITLDIEVKEGDR